MKTAKFILVDEIKQKIKIDPRIITYDTGY